MKLLVLIMFFCFATAEITNLPLLKLPYGTWRATKYDPQAEVYTFKNVRYAAAPIGSRRFAKPADPPAVLGVQDGSQGAACMQPDALRFSGNGTALRNQTLQDSAIPDIDQLLLASLHNTTYSEDCLFLDLYVPKKAFHPRAKLPTIVYIHGGGFSTGAKDYFNIIGLFDGTGLVYRSKGQAIVVAINYRLGAFGWLGGSSAEQAHATNLGLLNQRQAFKWVQKYIHLVGGDRRQVSAWGESAGGGSIMHHLVLKGGQLLPLFKHAHLHSSGFQYSLNRHGRLEDLFQAFAEAAGCKNKGFACLRATNPTDLLRAQIEAAGATFTIGRTQFGPVPDGHWIRQSPPLEMAQGRYAKIPGSLILTHAADDGALFVDQSIITDEALTKFIKAAFTYDDVAASVLARYPAAKYPSVIARQSAIINDAVFTCNYRWVANAYPGMTYNAQIAFGTGLHGAILPGAFFNPTLSINASGTSFPVPAVWGRESLYRGFQSYVVNHAISGNPNSARVPLNGIKWPQASTTQSERLSNVLNVTNDGYQLITDGLGLKSTCEFWLSVHSKLTQRAHY